MPRTSGLVLLLALAAPAAGAQAPIWAARYNGGFLDADATPGTCLGTPPQSLALDGSGHVYVTGWVTRPYAESSWRTVKYDPDGTRVWSVAYHTPGEGNALAYAIAVDTAGNAYVTGVACEASACGARTIKYAAADGAEVWSVALANANLTGIAVDAAGDAVVAGALDGHPLAVKYASADGSLLWSVAEPTLTGSYVAVALDGSGNAHVAGTAGTWPGPYDFHTAKYGSADGGVLWSATYDGPSHGQDTVAGLALDPWGNAYVTGSSETGFRTLKYAASNGAVIWSAAHVPPYLPGSHGHDTAVAIAVDPVGNAFVTGYAWSGLNTASENIRTIKYAAATGVEAWNVTYDGPVHGEDRPWALAADASGDLYLAGYTSEATSWDFRTIKYNGAGGAILWQASHGGSAQNNDEAFTVKLDAAGNPHVTGSDWNATGDMRTIKYAGASGAVLFSVDEGPTLGRDDELAWAGLDASGNAYQVGTSGAGSFSEVRVVKRNPVNGQILWSRTDAGIGSASAAAGDAAGHVYAVGRLWTASGPEFRMVKHAPADGSALWSTMLANGFQDLAGLVLGAQGGVYATGSEGTYGSHAFRTVKYSNQDGSVLWSARYDGPADDRPSGIAVDAAGNAYVTGCSGTGSSSDFHTIKYAASNGAVIWSMDYDGPAHGQDCATAIALDAAGNAYVTGYSSTGSKLIYTTIKYEASDGYPLWVTQHNSGWPSFDDRPTAIALDSAGNVYVTGNKGDGDSWSDYLTVKHAGADGAVLWSASYDGAGHSTDVAAGLAVDAAGDVYVTGGSRLAWEFDILTVRHSGLDGSTSWAARYDAGPYDVGRFVIARGDALFVAGASFVPIANADILTLRYDLAPPSVPAGLVSLTHAEGAWRRASQVGMRWWGALDPPPSSGMAGYSLVFDTAPATVPDMTVDVAQAADPHAVTSAVLPDGQSHYFHVRSCDQGGNCSPAKHAGPYWIDTTAPGAPPTVTSSSHTAGVPSNLTTLALQWTASSDPLSNGVASGIDGYGWAFDDQASAPCRQIKLAEEGVTTATVEVAPGTWYAHVCARDNAGNWSGVASAGPYLIGDPADLSLALADDVDPIHVNGTVTYTATYGNAGPSLAPSAVLRVTLPQGLAFVSSVPGVCSAEASDAVLCALGDLSTSSGGTVAVTAQALPATKGLQTVSAELRAATSDPDLANNDAVQTTLVKFVKGDLQDDWATDLFLRNTTTGENLVWLMNGTTRLSQSPIDPATPAQATQQVAGVDDFDGDGRNDLVFWDTATGEAEFWLMNGPARVGAPEPLAGAPPASWKLSATADFDHDGQPDLLWRNVATQKLVVWTLNGTAKAGEIVPSPDQAAHANWEVVGAVDLNGDGNVDLLWYNASTGKVVYWWMDAALHRITGNFTNPPNAGSANWRVLATGDYGAGPGGLEGTADLVWRNDTTGRFVVWHMDQAGNRTAGTFTTPDQPDTTPLDWTIVGPR